MSKPRHLRSQRVGRYLPPLGDEFISVEALSGLALVAAAVGALVWVNLATASYTDVWSTELGALTARAWVNEALMAAFFFVVGLEVKRELVEGDLRSWRTAATPVIAAVGGMLVPALCYVAFNVDGIGVSGWGIPMATDLACALGVLALLGPRVPVGVKVFVLALAIVDDIGSIVVVALFYTEAVHAEWLLGSAFVVASIVALRGFGIRHPAIYLLPGVALWLTLREAGVSPAIAGALLGLLVSAASTNEAGAAERLEHRLHPWTGFIVVPLFALANAGIVLDADALSAAASSSVTWGIVVARVVGKLVGISLFALLALRLGVGRLPSGMRPVAVVGIGALAGIGFTVALFISEESLTGSALAEAKIGVLVSAIAAAVVGAATIAAIARGRDAPTMTDA